MSNNVFDFNGGFDFVYDENRPTAPKELSEYGRGIWKDAVDKMPMGWFSAEQLPLLLAYCRGFERIRELNKTIQQTKWDLLNSTDQTAYIRLTGVLLKEQNGVVKMGDKLRINKQSQDARRAKKTDAYPPVDTESGTESSNKTPWGDK